MKLRYSATSPYVRKVVAVAIEAGLNDKIKRLATDVWNAKSDIRQDNPLSKVPALILDDGMILFDSPVIAEYLDSQHSGAKLFPPAGPARWTALRQQAIGDGICDAAILRRMESQRTDPMPLQTWIARQTAAMNASLDVLEDEADDLGDVSTIGTLAIACALGYLDLRFGGDNWRGRRPALAAWYEEFAARPSIAESAPPSA